MPLCSGGICLIYIEANPSRAGLWKLVFVSKTVSDFLAKFTEIKQALAMLWGASFHFQLFAVVRVFGLNLLDADYLGPRPVGRQRWHNERTEKNQRCYKDSP
ncbi:MAG: hypothetical protein WCE72_14785 [Pseudolabrys sp.]